MTPDSEWGRLMQRLREECELSRNARAQIPEPVVPINQDNEE